MKKILMLTLVALSIHAMEDTFVIKQPDGEKNIAQPTTSELDILTTFQPDIPTLWNQWTIEMCKNEQNGDRLAALLAGFSVLQSMDYDLLPEKYRQTLREICTNFTTMAVSHKNQTNNTPENAEFDKFVHNLHDNRFNLSAIKWAKEHVRNDTYKDNLEWPTKFIGLASDEALPNLSPQTLRKSRLETLKIEKKKLLQPVSTDDLFEYLLVRHAVEQCTIS